MTKADSSTDFGPGNPPFKDFPLTFSHGGKLTKRISGKVETFGRWDQGKPEIYKAVSKYWNQHKPLKDCPLTFHVRGGLIKKYNGKPRRFGRWDQGLDAIREAVDDFLKAKPYLDAGQEPPAEGEDNAVTVGDVCGVFLNYQQSRVHSGEIKQCTFDTLKEATDDITGYLTTRRCAHTLTPQDFQGFRAHLAGRYGQVRLSNTIGRVRAVFEFAKDSKLISEFDPGPTFKKIKKPKRNDYGERTFSPEDIHAMLDVADRPMRAWILLGMNCGFDGADFHYMRTSMINWWGWNPRWHGWDPESYHGWLHFPRVKVERYERPRDVPLWPETRDALIEVIDYRPKDIPREYADRVFLTSHRKPLGENKAVCQRFRRLVKAIGIHRKGMGFKWFRHNFETIAGGCRDQVAVDYIMCHSSNSMAGVYREGIDPQRLVDATNHVHDWLFSG